MHTARNNHRSPRRCRQTPVASALILACALSPTAHAADDEVAEPWLTDRYEVEIIVFRHADQGRNTEEQPASEMIDRFSSLALYPDSNSGPFVGPRERREADDRAYDPPEVTFELLDVLPTYPDFTTLDDANLRLGRVYDRLERLDAYTPIVHRAWGQAARPAERSVPMRIAARAGGEFNLDGTITLYKERFVHLAVDLDLAPEVAPQFTGDAAAVPTYGDVFSGGDPPPTPLQANAKPAFKLQESRRIRGANAQYFDHPQFGVIARITQIEIEDDSAGMAETAGAN